MKTGPWTSPRFSTRARRRAGAIALSSLAGACAARMDQAAPPGAIELPAQPPATEPAESRESLQAEPSPAASPPESEDPPSPPLALELWAAWSSPYPRPRAFAEELRAARAARAGFERALGPIVAGADGGAPAPKQFEQVSAMVDQANRRYASAYHASDATPSDKIDALREAAEMILAWSRRLDEAGLARAPAAYKADPAVALTFEDVADGPAKRWRADGLALLQHCIDSARASGVDSASARGCAAMRRSYARVIAQRPATPHDGGAASACVCNPGDPLCSATMNGWCRSR